MYRVYGSVQDPLLHVIHWSGNYKVREKEIIGWQNIKKVVISENGITIKYMSTYFTDTVPFATINSQDKELLLAALREQLSSRSIVSEDRLAAWRKLE